MQTYLQGWYLARSFGLIFGRSRASSRDQSGTWYDTSAKPERHFTKGTFGKPCSTGKDAKHASSGASFSVPFRGVQVLRLRRLILLHEKKVRRTAKMRQNCDPSVPPPEALYEKMRNVRTISTKKKWKIGKGLDGPCRLF